MNMNYRTLVSALLATMPVGCGYYGLVPEPNDTNGECVPSMVTRTRVPSVRYDADLVLLCTDCDIDECNTLGARCEIEGETCDFYGKLGVCKGCCDSEYGELHCALEGY